MILQRSSQKAVSEEEFIDPKQSRYAIKKPLLEEIQSLFKIFYIAA